MSDPKLEGIDSEMALRALVILAAADRAERDPPPQVATERLLHEAGLSSTQIGTILDEKADTIRKRLERAGKAESKPNAKAKKK
jgi:hypothetical protein